MKEKIFDAIKLAENIIDGDRIKRGDDVEFLLTMPLDELQAGAHEIQKNFCGNHIDFCTIINGKSGRCGENCKYCAQAACHKTGIEEYDFLPKEEIYRHALINQNAGVNRFSIVTSGRALSGKDFEKALEAYKFLHEKLTIDLCASHGILTREQFKRLKMTGVTSYHHNIETSKRFFPFICTSHTYDDRIKTIKIAQAEGFCVCSGGIIGMGETWQDRIDMAISLHELGIESIPINALMPVKGTALENRDQLSADEILRTIAIFRYINPTANIRLAAGRKLLPDNGASAFINGASASITGDMLTTSGTTIVEDMEILKRLGLTNKNSFNNAGTSKVG
ncbi:MAG: biotin synthase BioB [Selenomonadaceae bacterium]|nr:biotin synthase BioB [Selenomonadaceae bacterium]